MGAAEKLGTNHGLGLRPHPKRVAQMPRTPHPPRLELVHREPQSETGRLREHLTASFEEIRVLRRALAMCRVRLVSYEVTGTSERFEALRDLWKEDVLGLSDLQEIVTHPAYEAIIAMGWEVVPLVLNDLKRAPDHWHVALRIITEEQPVPLAQSGRMQAIRDAWLDWGRTRGMVT